MHIEGCVLNELCTLDFLNDTILNTSFLCIINKN